jgi:hypothetical protein
MIDVHVIVEGDENYQNNIIVYHKYHDAVSFVMNYIKEKDPNKWFARNCDNGNLLWVKNNSWIRIESYKLK